MNLRPLISRVPMAIAHFFRVLVGFILTSNGLMWLGRPDGGAYLTEFLSETFQLGKTIGLYMPFLENVVIPNPGVFAFLVSWGELLAGISLLLGAASRLGAGGASFLFLHYGLMGGFASLGIHLILSAMAVIPVAFHSGRRLGIDRWFHAKWPDARIW